MTVTHERDTAPMTPERFARLHTPQTPGEGRRAARRGVPVAQAAKRPLGNTAISPSANDQARWEALHELWSLSELGRVRKCKRVLAKGAEYVGVRHSADGGVGFSGLQTCGSTWACPLCSARIAMQRKGEVQQALEWSAAQNGEAVHVTLTVRHHAGQSLKSVWDAVTAGWRRVTTGRAWKADQALFGIAGWVRVVETTHSERHGWHVHVHALVFLDRRVSHETARALGDRMWDRWDTGLRSKGMSSQRRNRHGEDVGVTARRASDAGHLEALGGYLSKNVYESVAFEVANGQGKVARGTESRTPFQVLATLAGMVRTRTGDMSDAYDADEYERDLALWHEWEATSKGRQQMTWSRNGFKERAGIGEVTDEEIAEQEVGDTDVLLLTPETWQAVRWCAWRVKSVVVESGIAGLRVWLTERGLEWIDTGSE